MSKSIQRSFGLDFARVVAISLVLFSHFISNLDYLGFWGVEIFFALSGFLIGHIIWRSFNQEQRFSFENLSNFWQRRWWRTLPNYYLFFIVMLVFHYFQDKSLPVFNTLFNFLWFGQYLLDHNFSFYSVSWSLCIEEWFYLLFPIILFLINRIISKKKVSFTITLLIFISVSILIRCLLINGGEAKSLRGITFARLDSITYGVVVAFICSISRLKIQYKLIGFVFGLILMASPGISIYQFNSTYKNIINSPLYLIAVPLGASLTLPLLNLLTPPKDKFKLISMFIEKLSVWSYSIYLIHTPIMWLSYYLMTSIRTNIFGNIISKIVGIALTIFLSSIIYKFFEKPLLKKRPIEYIVQLGQLKSIKKIKRVSSEL